jgi:hypothetical protein
MGPAPSLRAGITKMATAAHQPINSATTQFLTSITPAAGVDIATNRAALPINSGLVSTLEEALTKCRYHGDVTTCRCHPVPIDALSQLGIPGKHCVAGSMVVAHQHRDNRKSIHCLATAVGNGRRSHTIRRWVVVISWTMVTPWTPSSGFCFVADRAGRAR